MTNFSGVGNVFVEVPLWYDTGRPPTKPRPRKDAVAGERAMRRGDAEQEECANEAMASVVNFRRRFCSKWEPEMKEPDAQHDYIR